MSDSSEKRLDASLHKATEALGKLERALRWIDDDPLAGDRWGRFDAVAKRFEVAFGYTWKALKTALDVQGVETYGPKDSIASASAYLWIDDVEQWVTFLETRNAGVHDYFGLSDEEYTATARLFLEHARATLQRVPTT